MEVVCKYNNTGISCVEHQHTWLFITYIFNLALLLKKKGIKKKFKIVSHVEFDCLKQF